MRIADHSYYYIMEDKKTQPDDNMNVVEDIVEVDGKKMKRIRKYEKKLVKHYTPKGVIERKSMKPFGIDGMGECSALDRNPVFFVVHGRSKQIKVKVNSLPIINQQLKEIDNEIQSKKMQIKELDEGPEIDFREGRRFERTITEDAVVRVSNIPNEINAQQIREMFSEYGKLIMMSMPRPFVITEEEKIFQKRRERLAKKRAKHLAKINPEALKEIERQEEQKRPPEETTHRGYAYIYFEKAEDANKAIKEMNEMAYYNQVISVKKAKPRFRS